MRRALLILLILALPLAQAQSADLFLYQDLLLTTTIAGDVNINSVGDNFYVEYVTADLSWQPEDTYRQSVQTIKTTPYAKVEDHMVYFRWDEPKDTNLKFSLDTKMITKNEFVKVKNKVNFPLKSFDRAHLVYLQPGTITDINPEIIQLAKDLSADEDDLYQVVFNLADWVKQNIEYDLSTVTADAAQKSSWVLENRYGVCDELTSLFISMCRSLGIPAKFISGVAYTDLEQFDDHWGPHGWAEVYFPGTGWVPFDVTYRELGYLDATHLKLKESSDSKHSSVEYLSRGRDLELHAGRLDISTQVLKQGTKIIPLIDINLKTKYKTIGFGSFNLITAEIKNMQDFYVTADLSLSRTEELEVFNPHKQSTLLKPKQSKKIYWLTRVDETLKEGFIYTFPVEVHGIRGGVSKSEFKVQRSSPFYTKTEALGAVSTDTEGKPPKIFVTCERLDTPIFTGDSAEISCKIENNHKSGTGKICVENMCDTVSLNVGTNQYSSSISFNEVGLTNIVVTVDLEQESSKEIVLFDVLDASNLDIVEVTYPETMGFKDQERISFKLVKKSSAFPKNVIIKVDHALIKQTWKLTSLEFDQIYELEFRGSSMKLKNNIFTVSVSWEDEIGNKYNKETRFEVMLENLSFWQKVILWFSNLEEYLLNLKNK